MPKKIKLRTWISRNRKLIDSVIRSQIDDNSFRINDNERRIWVLNDEGLYLAARGDGASVDD